MTYRRGLGQAKWVPGQISFMTLPEGRTSLPSVQPLLEAGLPIAPYIEHGSFETGEPAIMRYGLDPYRAIMGLGTVPFAARWQAAFRTHTASRRRGKPPRRLAARRGRPALGQILTDYACSETALNQAWVGRAQATLGASLRTSLVVGAAAGFVGAVMTQNPLVGLAAGGGIGLIANSILMAPYQV